MAAGMRAAVFAASTLLAVLLSGTCAMPLAQIPGAVYMYDPVLGANEWDAAVRMGFTRTPVDEVCCARNDQR